PAGCATRTPARLGHPRPGPPLPHRGRIEGILMREPFRRRDFRLLFAGVVATMTGESVLFLVLAIWVKDLTGSTSMAGLTLFALAAPALFAPVLGWVVDRFR